MYFLTQTQNNVLAQELKRLIGICYRTAWRLKHQRLPVMTEREAPRQRDGRVEIDDSYLRGELPGEKAGRGSENKVSFIAAVKTTDDPRPLLAVFSRVKTFSLAEVEAWATKHLAVSAPVASDGWACFTAVTQAGCPHPQEEVGKKRKSPDRSCFLWENTISRYFKTAIAINGTYHSFDFEKDAYRYLAERQ